MYDEIYGERFFLEFQDHGDLIPDQITVNKVLYQLGQRYGLSMVATNDSHFCRWEERHAHRTLLDIHPAGKSLHSSPHTYYRSNEEMASLFEPSMLTNTLEIASAIERYHLGSHTPRLPLSPLEDTDPRSTLRRLVIEGLIQKFGSPEMIPFDYEIRLEYELSIMDKTEEQLGVPFERYMLIIADLTNYARSQGIPFGPRGKCRWISDLLGTGY